MLKQVETVKLKSAELEGVKVALMRERVPFACNIVTGETMGTRIQYRVNINDGHTPRTRVFTDYNEASGLFDSYVQGN